RIVDGDGVMAVDHDRVTAEGPDPRRVRLDVPFELRRPALSEAIDVEDRGEVRQTLVSGVVEALPDRSLGELAVSGERPDVERGVQRALRGERLADRDGEPLTERAGGDIGPRQDGRRVALEAAPEPAEGHELGVVDRPGRA